MKNVNEPTNLIQYHLKMSKDHTSFLYFTLEANEGIAFFSTLPFEKGQAYREVVVNCTQELKDDLENILNHLRERINFEILSTQTISD